MSSLQNLKVTGVLVLALLVAGPGCLSMQSQTSLDPTSPGTHPFVEAYIEYPGPQAKWAGPASFILHVNAKDSGAAQITMTPNLTVDHTEIQEAPAKEVPTSTSRLPASSALGAAGAPISVPANKKVMMSEEAREQIAHLSGALQGGGTPFRGCMYPVRVRLVKSDGALVEKLGCRSELGWSRAVSETVNVFIQASVHGTQLEHAATVTLRD